MRGREIMSVADLLFSGRKLGFLLNMEDSVLHIHRDLKSDISEILDV